MTGSTHIFSRQSSSTVTSSNTNEKGIAKLRRCSSADNRSSVELLSNTIILDGISLPKNEGLLVENDSGTEDVEQTIEPVFTAAIDEDKDDFSDISSDANCDEGYSDLTIENNKQINFIKNDLQLAAKIPDEMKKDICENTKVVFHAEFARLIAVPLSLYYRCRLYLFAEEELYGFDCSRFQFEFQKLDNAKAQFKCTKPSCGHTWTSMRARISFSCGNPQSGLVILKIFNQNCKLCNSEAHSIWYTDEICRVMKNLALTLFQSFYPNMVNYVDLTHNKPIDDTNQKVRHDPFQRKGKMNAPHNRELCEACQRNSCFI